MIKERMNVVENLMNVGLKTICSPVVQKILNKVFGVNPHDFNLGFQKIRGRWYADIRNWPKAYFENQMMVAGADRLLEYLAEGGDYVTLHVKTTPFEGATHLSKVEEDEWGGTYEVDDSVIDHTVWLCNVAKFVMGAHPQDLYYEVVEAA